MENNLNFGFRIRNWFQQRLLILVDRINDFQALFNVSMFLMLASFLFFILFEVKF